MRIEGARSWNLISRARDRGEAQTFASFGNDGRRKYHLSAYPSADDPSV